MLNKILLFSITIGTVMTHGSGEQRSMPYGSFNFTQDQKDLLEQSTLKTLQKMNGSNSKAQKTLKDAQLIKNATENFLDAAKNDDSSLKEKLRRATLRATLKGQSFKK